MVRYQDLPEDFLHFVWSQGLFKKKNLQSFNGESIEIIDVGMVNTDAGPDFENSKVSIDGMLWAGSVEIHIKSSDWYLHGHETDDRYENVVLHVVLDNDRDVYRQDGSIIPCLELKGLIRNQIIENYHYLNSRLDDVPCQEQFNDIDRMRKLVTLDRMIVERLEEKSSVILQELKESDGDSRELSYKLLSKTLGYKVNSTPMTELSKRVSYKVLRKHKDNLQQVEALLFGTSGLLQANFRDEYLLSLNKEAAFLTKKYSIQPLEPISWKFSRMRPANFPTLRIAQLAQIVCTQNDLFSVFIEANDIGSVEEILKIRQSEYWQSHVLPDQEANELFRGMGQDIRNRILINVVVPLVFAYGVQFNKQDYKDKAIDWLESLPVENNKIIRKWNSIGMTIKTALDSQASIQLMTRYCHNKKCLQCPIGMDILRKKQ